MAEPTNHYGGAADDDDDEEADIDETGYKTVKDAVLFAIDVSKTMLQGPPHHVDSKVEHDRPTLAALKCAYSLMQQRIISNPNDMMGVLLFGTEESRFQEEDEHIKGLSYPHCYLLTDLGVPAAADVKRLKDIVEDEDESKAILRPSSSEVSMANVLFCANQIFTSKAPNFTSRRLFIVTDQDQPHVNDKTLRSAATVRAKDLYDLGVIIELFPISRPDHAFDRSVFYDDIIYSSTASDPDAPAPLTKAAKAASSGDGISLLQSLLSSIASKAAPRRALFSSLPFEIAPGLKISIKGYILFKKQEPVRSSYVYTGGDKAQIVLSSSVYMAEDTARTVEKVEIRKAYKFGGETVTFSLEEMKEIRNFGDPILRLIGFKPISMLPSWANYKPSTFMYPSEQDFIGSSRVFSALQQKLSRDRKMGIAWFIARKTAVPALVAILPGDEELDEEGTQKVPPGLWIHPLPYADDVRSPPDVNIVRTTDDLVDQMRVIVQQLSLPKGVYEPSKYPNPALQWFYQILQAMALEEDLPEQATDETMPRHKQIHKRAGEYVLRWGQTLEQAYRAYTKENAGSLTDSGASKRGPLSNGGSRAEPGKKAKAANGGVLAKSSDGPMSDSDMRMHFQKNSIGKLTVPTLKDWAAGKGIKPATKKAELVDQVTEWFERKMDLG